MASFDELLEISSLIEKRNTSPNPNLETLRKGTSLYSKLYQIVISGKCKKDEEAISVLYGSDGVKRGTYQKLKDRLLGKLIDNLLTSNLKTKKKQTYSAVYSDVYKEYSAIKLLLGNYARNSAVSLSEKLLKKTQEFTFTDINIELCRILTLHYSNITLNKDKFEKYSQILSENLKLLEKEIIIESYYCELTRHFTLSEENKPELIEIATKFSRECQAFLKKRVSYKIALYSFFIIILEKELVGDYQAVRGWANKALTYFTPKFLSSSVRFGFKYKIIESNFRSEKYLKAQESIHELEQSTPTNSINWFNLQSLLFILSIYTKDYSSIQTVYHTSVNNPHFKTMPQQIQERWRIHEAYLQYLIAIGKVDARRSRKFRLHKFLNEVPIYSRDKRGANISILILQVLFLLNQRDYDRILDRIEALRMYHRRYLRRKDTARSNLFIRMLMLLPETDFHRERIIHRGRRHLAKLQTLPLQTVNQSLELEIIPYPELWQYLIDALE